MPPLTVAVAPVDAVAIEELLVHERLMRAEADHRMANLLQIVSSTLGRAALHADGSHARVQLQRAAAQLTSIDMLHRALDLRSHHGLEDVVGKVRQLCTALEALLLQPFGHTLGLTVRAPTGSVLVSAVLARCLAAVVNELVTNAAKHAFTNDYCGRVTVELIRTQDHLSCTVRDDGSGNLPAATPSTSRGMVLAETLAARFGGGCSWVFGPAGTVATVMLPLQAPLTMLAATGPERTGWQRLWQRIFGREG